MTTPEAELFCTAAVAFAATVARVPADAWQRPGLGEWDVRELVAHTGRAVLTVETYLMPEPGPVALTDPVDYLRTLTGAADPDQRAAADAAVAERGRQAAAVLGDQPAVTVAGQVSRVCALVRGAPEGSTVRTPAGIMPLTAYLPTRVFELAVHTLDLCRAVGLQPPADLASAVAASTELAGRLAARRWDAAELLLLLTGRDVTPRPRVL
ncbi:maleylpyruvate isomerase N-terminal domain-containing protein [Isoptericola sp. b441]|uniref:Maleylpyruvate isomerase N-terminal domain-containing protein n=1 Tax=Actinotalea lenta TaxID=3064654 RepID=A0ABT9D8Y9_9CELL|nr:MULTISPECIES: maleylpyruvate isomerase N-terminal domain-containing protein [unclassified Isoptericola]MDO8106926.1 maleylpyruvate isomerase N-terminal domain-containing protein [Isoptericola sp. b441]MDO8121363.1 maleylpyruvate isomerase N-terminal domain-containing protein [Isoptericola sp. b490]